MEKYKVKCIEKFIGQSVNGDPDLNTKPDGLPQVDQIYTVKGETDVSEAGLELDELALYEGTPSTPKGWVARKFVKHDE